MNFRQDEPNKPIVLLCWGYHRKGWIESFQKLQHQFNFIFLFYSSPDEDHENIPFRRMYWRDYSSPYDILNEISPKKVVFMSIDTGYAIGLNIACKNKGVQTFVLQHGLYHNYKFYREQERNIKKKAKPLPQSTSKKQLSTYRFLFKSFKVKNIIKVPSLLFYFMLYKLEGIHYAHKHVKSYLKEPCLYICYTIFNARIHVERERISSSQIKLIGNPSYDAYFKYRSTNGKQATPYYLLIDQPFVENQYNTDAVSASQMNSFYSKLNSFALTKGCRLKIKLHPESYKSNFMILDENVDYLKEEDLVSLIMEAEGCFGTFSNALVPAIYFKKCYIFKILNSETQQDLITSGLVKSLDFYQFDPDQIDFENFEKDERSIDTFVQKYFYKADGNSIKRLSEILAK